MLDSLTHIELDDELLLICDEEWELLDELSDGVEEQDEQLPLLLVSLEEVLLEDEEDWRRKHQLLLEELLDFEYADELELDEQLDTAVFETQLQEQLDENETSEELQLEDNSDGKEQLDFELLLLRLDFELWEGDVEEDELDWLSALEELQEQLSEVELSDSELDELLELVLHQDSEGEELLQLWLLSLIDRELDEELLLWDEDGELEEELVDHGMQEEEELLLLLDISLQHALLD